MAGFTTGQKQALFVFISLSVISYLFFGWLLFWDVDAYINAKESNDQCYISQCNFFVDTCKRNCHNSWCEPYQCTGTQMVLQSPEKDFNNTLYKTFDILQDAIDFCGNFYAQKEIECYTDDDKVYYGHKESTKFVIFMVLESFFLLLALIADLWLIFGMLIPKMREIEPTQKKAYLNL
jgi:hypothetical protein